MVRRLYSISLKAVIALAVPLLLADGDNSNEQSVFSGVSLGFEVGANIHDVSWGSTVSGAQAAGTVAGAIPSTYQSLLNTSRFVLTEGHDKSPYYGFTGAVFAKSALTEDFYAMIRLGYDFSGTDAITMKSVTAVGEVNANNTALLTPHGGFDTTGTIKLKSAFSPALFVGYESLYLGVIYQMNTYEVTDSVAQNLVLYVLTQPSHGADLTLATPSYPNDYIGTAISAGDIEESMLLFGFKALQPAQVDEFSVTLSAEAFTNFGIAAGDDMKIHYKNLVSQLQSASPQALNNEELGNLNVWAWDALSWPDDSFARYTQSQLYTNYYRLGLSIAMELTTL